jgi:hypothetical protein
LKVLKPLLKKRYPWIKSSSEMLKKLQRFESLSKVKEKQPCIALGCFA